MSLDDLSILRSLLENSDVPMLAIDTDQRVRLVSAACEKLTGYTAGELLGNPFPMEFMDKQQIAERAALLSLELGTVVEPGIDVLTIKASRGLHDRQVWNINHKCGNAIPMSIAVTAIKDNKDTITGFLGVAFDLTGTRQLENELHLTSQRFGDILENVSDWVWELDVNGNFSYVSAGVEKILGYTPEEVLKMSAFDLMFPDEAERVARVYEKIIAARRPFRDMLNENRHKDGHPVKLLSSGVPFFDEDGNLLGYRGADRDVTEQEYLKQRFAQSEKRFRDMFNLSPDPMWVAEDDQLLECNYAAVENFAYDNRHEFLGAGFSSLVMDAVSEPAGIKNQLFSEQMAVIKTRRVTRFDWLCRRRDGSTFWAELTVTPFRIHDKGLLLFTCRDISERKLAEKVLDDHRMLLEEEVRYRTEELEKAVQAANQANESKSRFLANMSHELRTPMHAIMSFSNLGIKRAETDLLKGYLEKINLSGQRLTKLLDDLLDLSKLESGKLEPVFAEDDLTLVVLQALDHLSSLMSDKNISVDMDTDQPMVAEIDKNLIMQVVVNMLSNAVKFSPSGSVISVRIDEIERDDGRFLRYVTRDEGVGIPENELETVFDSFVQSSKTRSNSGGTGLGLPISREIIQLHRGRIWAESPAEGGDGTTVIFEIPLKQPGKR